MWVAGLFGFTVVIGGIVLSLIPPAEAPSHAMFEVKLVVGTLGAFLLGLVLYVRGARAKSREAVPAPIS